MKLNELLKGLTVLAATADMDTDITDVCYDSRQTAEGGLFVAIAGAETDGHRFIPMAREKGAACVVCQHAPDGDIPYVVVEDSRRALAVIACNWFDHPSREMTMIGVTGTSGKTNEDGNTTVGWEDEDGDRWTLTVTVEDYETGRPIEDAEVSIGKGGNITVTLPDGTDMDEDNRITVTVTDNERDPQEDVTVIVKGDLGQRETGETDEDGKLTVPAVTETEYHGAYIVGYTDGTFGPERSMSRSEAAAIFARLLSDKLDERIPSGNNVKFKDIDPDMWYAGYVEYLTGYGVAVGYNDRTYRGDKAITRAEFTAMAARFFDVYGDGAEEIMEQYEGFDDVSDGYWAAEYIKDAAIHGWVEGYGDGTFRADDPIDRAEVVTIVNRLLGREADEDYIADNRRQLVTFPDVSSRHWAYYNVLEAANAHTANLTNPETWDK